MYAKILLNEQNVIQANSCKNKHTCTNPHQTTYICSYYYSTLPLLKKLIFIYMLVRNVHINSPAALSNLTEYSERSIQEN